MAQPVAAQPVSPTTRPGRSECSCVTGLPRTARHGLAQRAWKPPAPSPHREASGSVAAGSRATWPYQHGPPRLAMPLLKANNEFLNSVSELPPVGAAAGTRPVHAPADEVTGRCRNYGFRSPRLARPLLPLRTLPPTSDQGGDNTSGRRDEGSNDDLHGFPLPAGVRRRFAP